MRRTGRTTLALLTLLHECIKHSKRGYFVVHARGMIPYVLDIARRNGLEVNSHDSRISNLHYPENHVQVITYEGSEEKLWGAKDTLRARDHSVH